MEQLYENHRRVIKEKGILSGCRLAFPGVWCWLPGSTICKDNFVVMRNQNNDSSPHPRPLSKVERGVVTVETGIPSNLLTNARQLRKNQTKAERVLWQAIRNRKLNNWKFRRQHPISEGFILDFYCVEIIAFTNNPPLPILPSPPWRGVRGEEKKRR
jgi:hypothetical protein